MLNIIVVVVVGYLLSGGRYRGKRRSGLEEKLACRTQQCIRHHSNSCESNESACELSQLTCGCACNGHVVSVSAVLATELGSS